MSLNITIVFTYLEHTYMISNIELYELQLLLRWPNYSWNNVMIHPMNEKSPSVVFFALQFFSSTQTFSVGLDAHAVSIHFSLAIFSIIPSPILFFLQSYAWQTNLYLLAKQKFLRQFSWFDSGSFWQSFGGRKYLLLQLQFWTAITNTMTQVKIIDREYMIEVPFVLCSS